MSRKFPLLTLEESRCCKARAGWMEIDSSAPEHIKESLMKKFEAYGIRTTEPGPEYWEEDHFFDSWDANR
ncbi:MAG: hypothetical protein Q4D81_11995 [Eubacteriales bacterium]|nr:hypothetical protein [Eubacteriales bacterium]